MKFGEGERLTAASMAVAESIFVVGPSIAFEVIVFESLSDVGLGTIVKVQCGY